MINIRSGKTLMKTNVPNQQLRLKSTNRGKQVYTRERVRYGIKCERERGSMKEFAHLAHTRW